MSLPGIVAVKRDLTDKISAILNEFHKDIFKLVKIAKRLEPNMVELDSLNNKLSIARDLDPLLIINRAKDKFWHYHQQILDKDENFFLTNKFDSYIKNDENRPFMYTTMNLIKTHYKNMSDSEKNHIWNIIQNILKYIINYKKAISDFI